MGGGGGGGGGGGVLSPWLRSTAEQRDLGVRSGVERSRSALEGRPRILSRF